MKESGKLPDSFKTTLKELEESYEYYDYSPSPPLLFVWKSFWSIRKTKSHENPINYSDLYYFQKMNGIKLQIWECNTILVFDRNYYHFTNKHKD